MQWYQVIIQKHTSKTVKNKPKMSNVTEVNIDLDLNPADFQLCDGFGFYKFCLTGFGLDLFWTSQL